MTKYSEVFVAFDTSKTKHAVALAEGGRDGEIRYLGEIDSTPAAVERLVRKLGARYSKVHFCYEAGPTGYGLYRRLILDSGVMDVCSGDQGTDERAKKSSASFSCIVNELEEPEIAWEFLLGDTAMRAQPGSE